MSHYRLVPLAAAALLALPAARAGSGELAFEGHGGFFELAAGNTASAVYGSTGAPTFGGALRYTIWRGVFVSVGAHTFSKDGERVFVAAANAPVQRLGFPLTMRTTAYSMTVGYRVRDGHLIVPYVQGGLAATRYKITSEVAGESFNEDLSKTGPTGAVGVELGRGLVRLGAELGYTSAPNLLGTDGVSRVYGEKDAGGMYVIGKIALAFGGR
jgi:opacity protein-like surface antigen